MEPVSIKPLAEVLGETFAKELSSISIADANNTLLSGLYIVVSKNRELRRDAALAFLNDKLNDIYSERVVVVSDYPEEIPARPPKQDASLEEYTYAPAMFSVSPGNANLPDAGFFDALRGPQPSTTKLAKTILDFLRWDVYAILVLSPLETFSWDALVKVALTGHLVIAGVEREPGFQTSIGKDAMDALAVLGPSGVTVIDLDQQKIFKNLASAKIVA